MNFRNCGFWREAFALRGSVTPYVLPYVFGFGLIACAMWGASSIAERELDIRLAIEVAPFEFVGAALAVLMVLRTNAGYDRWWEARKLWGGMVNQSRNLGISAMAYGPVNRDWRDRFVRWVAVFPHVARCSLRGEKTSPEIVKLVGSENETKMFRSAHAPSFVALRLAELLREACDNQGMDRFAFIQLDRERATLIDHVGGCERILKTPLPLVYSIKIRRFIAIFLLTLPMALLYKLKQDWLVPIITMMAAYPLISLDQIGIELQNPFSKSNLSHLPLEDISSTIENNLTGILELKQNLGTDASPERDGQPVPESSRGAERVRT